MPLRIPKARVNDTSAQKIADTAQPIGEASLAERRQLTVIFADLASFTTLSQQLDPEDLNTVVHEYYAVCRAVCQRYEGHIANYLGDGVLMMFGYPKAHEDDAHRAVRTGLGIIEGMATLNTRLDHEMGLKLQVRVGIHTGLMVVGDDRAGDWQKMALGETLNVAARVQSVAQLDTVVVSPVTEQLVKGYFSCRSIGTHTLKGVSQPMELFTVLRESTARGRLEAAGRATLTPLTGRETEVAELLHEWTLASEGKGRALVMTGEGGLGKSRLVQMLKEHVANTTAAWLTPMQCSPYHQSTTMYPFIDLIERVVLKFERNESSRDRLHKLEGMILQYGIDPAEALPVFGTFHSLPPEAGYELTPMEPAQQRRYYMDTMVNIMKNRASRQPLLVVVEDLHWIDPTTLETLEEFVRGIHEYPILVVFTSRPEFVSPWTGHPGVHTLQLKRLDAAQTRTICLRVARGKTLPDEVVRQIIERADGVPLFAEELTKMIIGSGLLEERGDSYQLVGELPAMAIPSTLQDSLMARLDRLSSVKEIAQIAAVIGREFSYELIRYVHPLEEAFLRHALMELLDEEIIDQPAGETNANYHFKHALVQEAAYQSLVKSRRLHYHRLITHALEEHFPELVAVEPEMLAHHYTEANLGWQAIPYLQKAGEKAAARSSHNEAITHFTRALELVRTLSDSAQRWNYEIDLLIRNGASLTATRGYGAKEVEQTYSRARDLSEQFGAPGQLFRAKYGLWRTNMLRAEYDVATKLGEELLEIAVQQQNQAFQIASHRSLGATLFYRGQFERSLSHVDRVIELTDVEGDSNTLVRDIFDVVDLRVTCRSYRSWNLWMLGQRAKAHEESLRAIELAERIKHPFSLALALSFATWFAQFCGDIERVKLLAERSIKHCTERGFPFWIGWEQVLLGWADAHSCDISTGPIGFMHKGMAYWKEKGSNLGCGYFFCLMADTHLRFSETAQAMDALAQAHAFMQETGEFYWEAERLRLNGELALMRQPDSDTAATFFRQAIEIARRQKAKSLEERAVASLGKCTS
jgi:class 3 adenylate cyclase/predicted ATPase